MYNVLVVPVRYFAQGFFIGEWNPRGAFCQPFPILVIVYAGTTRASLSGFLYDKREK
jgi:hypothetical protein